MSTHAHTAPPPPRTSWGAWETIVDRAALEVTNYLVATVRPFDPTGPLSQHMLTLIDRSTLLDVMKERNYCGRCGRPGCSALPSGLEQGRAAQRRVDFSTWQSSEDDDKDKSSSGSDAGEDSKAASASSAEDDDRGKKKGRAGARTSTSTSTSRRARVSSAARVHTAEADAEEDNPMVKEGNMRLSAIAPDDERAEIVYEEDVHIAEAFRIAARAQRQMRGVRRRQARERAKQQQQQSRHTTRGQSTHPADTTAHGGMIGATMDDRFCSPLCREQFESELLPSAGGSLGYGDAALPGAIGALFPNLRPDVLRELAGQEAPGRAAVVKEVVERPIASTAEATAGLAPVTTGASHESPLTRAAALAGDTVAQMARRDAVWDAAVVYRLGPDVFLRSPGAGEDGERIREEGRARGQAEEGGGERLGALTAWRPARAGLRPLQGPLLVLDVLMTLSSNTTKKLFLIRHLHHRHRQPARGSTSVAATAAALSYVEQLVSPVRAVLDARADELARTLSHRTCEEGGSHLHDVADLLKLDDDLHVDPLLQQQRRELLVSQLFSNDLACALSRLLWVDVDVITDVAWEAVWYGPTSPLLLELSRGDRRGASKPSAGANRQQQYMAYSLLHSLTFPFAIPSSLMRPPSATGVTAPPEVIAMALVMLLAASLSSPAVADALRECEEQLEEVVLAVGMTADVVTAALRSLVLREDD